MDEVLEITAIVIQESLRSFFKKTYGYKLGPLLHPIFLRRHSETYFVQKVCSGFCICIWQHFLGRVWPKFAWSFQPVAGLEPHIRPFLKLNKNNYFLMEILAPRVGLGGKSLQKIYRIWIFILQTGHCFIQNRYSVARANSTGRFDSI